jgi:hypothetical protein
VTRKETGPFNVLWTGPFNVLWGRMAASSPKWSCATPEGNFGMTSCFSPSARVVHHCLWRML